MTVPSLAIAVVGTPNRAAFADAMLTGLHEGLLRNGVDSHLFLLSHDKEAAKIHAFFEDRRVAGGNLFLVDINGNFNLPLSPGKPTKMRFSFLIDHPFYHLHKFIDYPAPMTAGMIDVTHLSALADIGVNVPTVFFPHAGPDPCPDRSPLKDRDIDVLFCGNISPLVFTEIFDRRLGELPEKCRGIVGWAIERVLDAGSDVYNALKTSCREQSDSRLEDYPLRTLRGMLSLIESFAAGKLRLKYLKELLKLENRSVHIVGNIGEIIDQAGIEAPGSNVRFHDHLSFNEVVRMIRRTRLLVNANFTIVGGSHERIWQGMAGGCATLTNESVFVRSCFEDGKHILFLPRHAGDLGDLISSHLDRPRDLQAMADSALRLFADNHTWRQRVKTIIDLFEAAARS